ncbi:MAG: ATP-binding cassette domain-containing protein [Rehaibacterium terrae]|uniref:ATP-binding cassette domain-containing protein n=1 Tax=Rehaibacterium terrae TaxID=1341696 RepID=UPI00391C5E43
MPLITLHSVDYGVGGPLLLENVELAIEPGERIALIGRNGAGKSTLLRLLSGEIRPDDGEIRLQSGVRVARLQQEVPQGAAGSVFDVVAGGLGRLGADLAEFHRLSHAPAGQVDTKALAAVQARIEDAQGWSIDQRIAQVLTRLDLPEDADFAALSGGMKRRVLLAQALAAAPDVLLLDEPTNHLDIASIDWLEEFLRGFAGTLVFVTHDRRFLRSLATRIVEIDRGRVTSWPGDWDNYLRRREERLNAEAQENARFDKRLAQEEAWIRQGIKARRTRDEGRVRRLKAMRAERAKRREQAGSVKLALAEAGASGRKVIEAEGLSYGWDGQPIVRDFSTVIMRGDRVGLLGPNGSGKTTLLKLLLGELAPRAGRVKHGTQLQIAYFDQHRAALREDWNALDNVAEGREFIEVGGQRKHVLGYLQDFLFSPERARAPITRLSGGERNRLLLAKLFAQPSNLLVMDEPTNDLDVETLELLEEWLAEYPGTLLLVSHDRDFLDNVVTSTLVMEGDGRVGEYVGGYSDWLRQRPVPIAEPVRKTDDRLAAKPATPSAAPAPAKRKLSYKDARELEQLPARIETLEARLAELTARMSDPAFYQRDGAAIAAHNAEVARLQAELDAAYARWEALEGG